MTEEEITAATMLRGVTYPTASWDKRFAATIQIHLAMTPPMIGEKMVPQLWRLLLRYRRQIRHPEREKYIKLARERSAPDFRNPGYREANRKRMEIYRLKRAAANEEAQNEASP